MRRLADKWGQIAHLDDGRIILQLTLRRHLPNAQLTYDKFHVVKLVNSAMDEVRRREVGQKAESKKTRYIRWKNPSKLTAKQRSKLETLAKDNSETARAYNLKITFNDLFQCKNKEEG